uniref:Endonuclease/exonuclease/phosphatase domain-containing protein n=1 Tax=Compsopogon caeruleus TaxID=31354 RepID=A0A7S1THB1_9RHOD|mmetsp:Transcript_766/g.1618  ORF Transcript_766/g.1618 Transcript_766/m.1618 type:complete len:880 (+) Transcript_766:608-3247(+)
MGRVVEFLSYQGTFTASEGPAEGLTSRDVGVEETQNTPSGYSLQRKGNFPDFIWAEPLQNTFGAPNYDQSFSSIASVSLPPGDRGEIFFNELHYDNIGTDTGEAIELAGLMGSSVAGWALVLYNGDGGEPYATILIRGSLTNPVDGYGFLAINFPSNGLQNGFPGGDGIALVNPSAKVVEFISYQGTITANGGPADKMTSTNIDASEDGRTERGYSLQLTGTLGDFNWVGPRPSSFGKVNEGQSFRILQSPIPSKKSESSSPSVSSHSSPNKTSLKASASPSADATAPSPSQSDSSVPRFQNGLKIGQVQGEGHQSPFVGQQVTIVGVVTAVDANGFYLQDNGDSNPATSDGILVYTKSTPTVAVGSELSVTATVVEYVAGGARFNNLAITELTSPTIKVLRTEVPLPTPVVIGTGGRIPVRSLVDDDAFRNYQPDEDSIDFFESIEGMRVILKSPQAIAPINKFDTIFALVDGSDLTPLNPRGSLPINPTRFGSEKVRITWKSSLLPGFQTPNVSPGDTLSDVVGIVGYAYGNYGIIPTEKFNLKSTAKLSPTQSIEFGRLNTALLATTMNVLKLDPTDPQSRFQGLAQTIVKVLKEPDLIFLQEIQDNDGASKTDVTSASVTLQKLQEAIKEAGGPLYQTIDNPFIGDDTSGGEPGGNIRVAFLYDPERLRLAKGGLGCIVDPRDQRTNSNNPFYATRLPLTAQFEFLPTESSFEAINIHLPSKGGSAPLYGQLQPFEIRQDDPDVNGGIDKRRAAAQEIGKYVASHPERSFIVAGDCNEFQFSSAIASILTENLDLLTLKLPEKERYTYSFDGNAQQIDHALVSRNLSPNSKIQVAHVNSEFPAEDQVSDHDFIAFQIQFGTCDPLGGEGVCQPVS